MGKKSKLKLSKEERNVPNLISFMLKSYPNDEKELLNLFQNLDMGNGVVIKKMKDKKMRECLKIILKKTDFKKERKLGESVYSRSEKSESLVKIFNLVTGKVEEKPKVEEPKVNTEIRKTENPEEIDLDNFLEDESASFKRVRDSKETEATPKKTKME